MAEFTVVGVGASCRKFEIYSFKRHEKIPTLTTFSQCPIPCGGLLVVPLSTLALSFSDDGYVTFVIILYLDIRKHDSIGEWRLFVYVCINNFLSLGTMLSPYK